MSTMGWKPNKALQRTVANAPSDATLGLPSAATGRSRLQARLQVGHRDYQGHGIQRGRLEAHAFVAGSAGHLVFERTGFEPGIQARNPASEPGNLVLFRQGNRGCWHHALSHGAGVVMVLRKRSLGCGLRSSRATNSA